MTEGSIDSELVANGKGLVPRLGSGRRVVLRWLAVGVGAGLAAKASSSAERVEAANGDNITAGGTITATLPTTLQGTVAGAGTLRVTNSFTGGFDAFPDGIQGYTAGANNAGVFGRNNDLNGVGASGEGTNGTGVFGDSAGGSGVAGSSSTGSGVFGFASNASGNGVRGDNASTTSNTASGVFGTSAGGAGAGNGVLGQSGSGPGLFGFSGSGSGVVGSSTNGPGLQGFSTNQLGLSGVSTNNIGLLGQAATNTAMKGESVSGQAGNFTSNTAAVKSPATVTVANLAAVAINANTNALQVNGNFVVSNGTKSAAVRTSRGDTLLYCVESPVSVFEDFGRARLSGGSARVDLDSLFAETVDTASYAVYLTARGDTRGLYVSAQDAGGFAVQEAQGGSSSVEFDFRVVAQRAGLTAAHRLAAVTLPELPKVSLTKIDAPKVPDSRPGPTLPNRTGNGSTSSGNSTPSSVPNHR